MVNGKRYHTESVQENIKLEVYVQDGLHTAGVQKTGRLERYPVHAFERSRGGFARQGPYALGVWIQVYLACRVVCGEVGVGVSVVRRHFAWITLPRCFIEQLQPPILPARGPVRVRVFVL